MEERHEIIHFGKESPVNFFIQKLGDVSRHWHDSLELLFILAGEVEVLVDSRKTDLKKGDILLINRNTIHSLHAEDCVIIAVQIKLSRFSISSEYLDTLYFDCDSTRSNKTSYFLFIKKLLSFSIRTLFQDQNLNPFSIRAMAHLLMQHLVRYFGVKKPDAYPNTHKHLNRLNEIIQYINHHYTERLTLDDIAEMQHLSVPYLSSFFEKYMGVTLSDYYTGIRLDHATRELIHTDAPIQTIAEHNGFSDSRSFVRAFKKRYNGQLPSDYRKNLGASSFHQQEPLLAINYLDFKPENYFHLLYDYLPETPDILSEQPDSEDQTLSTDKINCSLRGKKLLHKWRTFIGVGRAGELLLQEVQDMLRQLQRETGFRYLRFHGIFADDMLVCRRGRDGLQFNFTLVDKVLDFVCSIGLKPLIQFSFMPSALAEQPEHTIFANPFTISMPANMEEWTCLVRTFLAHLRSRYGIRETRTWLYSVWNEPDTSREMFGLENEADFYRLYENTYQAVKDTDPQLIFGSPSLLPITEREYIWMRSFLTFTKGHNCTPDFMDVHYYSDDFEKVAASFSAPPTISGDPDHFRNYLEKLHSFLRFEKLDQLPLYVTEWNLTVSHRNLLNDTCFKACYLIRNYLENYDDPDAIGYWSVTDLIEEYQIPDQMYHGGLGLFTQNGVEKAVYYAMTMLSRLGSELLASGEGYFVTREGEQIRMILYNYEHINQQRLETGLALTDTERNGVFTSRRRLRINVPLTHLPEETYRVRETFINQAHGSSFDQWVLMGAPQLNASEAELLKSGSRPGLYIHQSQAPQGQLRFEALLEPQEVRLVELIPQSEGLAQTRE